MTEKLRGIRETRRPDGSGSFRIDFRAGQYGRRRELVSRYVDKESRKLALKIAKQKLNDRELEVLQGTYRPPDKRDTPFSDFADRFEKEYASKRKSQHYHYALKPLRRFFGSRNLSSITRAAVEDYMNSRTEEVGPSTLRKEVATLGTLLRYAVDRGVIGENVVSAVRKPREPESRVRYIPRSEWHRVEEEAPPWLRPIMTLAVATGLRLKEVVSLTWDDIDLAARRLYVAEDSKTGYRAAPLSPMALEVLQAQPRRVRCRYVFSLSNGEPYTSERQRNRVSCNARATLTRAGFDGFGFHTLRHTAASWMAEGGESLLVIGRVLGHKDPKTTAKYAHLVPDALDEAAKKMDAKWTPPSRHSGSEPAEGAASN